VALVDEEEDEEEIAATQEVVSVGEGEVVIAVGEAVDEVRFPASYDFFYAVHLQEEVSEAEAYNREAAGEALEETEGVAEVAAVAVVVAGG
jgi:hypothetical protein